MKENDPTQTETTAYEAPEVESVLTPEELTRQVHYAGNGPSPLTPS